MIVTVIASGERCCNGFQIESVIAGTSQPWNCGNYAEQCLHPPRCRANQLQNRKIEHSFRGCVTSSVTSSTTSSITSSITWNTVLCTVSPNTLRYQVPGTPHQIHRGHIHAPFQSNGGHRLPLLCYGALANPAPLSVEFNAYRGNPVWTGSRVFPPSCVRQRACSRSIRSPRRVVTSRAPRQTKAEKRA